MRARRAVYPASAGFRAAQNGCPLRKPVRAAALRVRALRRGAGAWNSPGAVTVVQVMPAPAGPSGCERFMTSRTLQSTLLALALVAGSAGMAAAQSTPNGNTSTSGSPAGSNSTGNGATGSGAAPSGK